MHGLCHAPFNEVTVIFIGWRLPVALRPKDFAARSVVPLTDHRAEYHVDRGSSTLALWSRARTAGIRCKRWANPALSILWLPNPFLRTFVTCLGHGLSITRFAPAG